MKKIILVLFSSTLMFSCNKKKIEPVSEEYGRKFVSEKYGVSTNGVFLTFKTLKDYEKVVEINPNEENTTDFKDFISVVQKMPYLSYTEHLETGKLKEDLVEDEFLSSILNKDFVVQIGDWIYKIDKKNEKVFVMSSSNIEFYSDLLEGNTRNKAIVDFSTEENVIELVEKVEGEEKALSKHCQRSDQYISKERYADWTDHHGIYGHQGRKYKFHYKGKVRFDNWGIYRKLFTKFKHWEVGGGTYDQTHFTIIYSFNYVNRQYSHGSGSRLSPYPYWSLYHSQATNIYDYYDKKKEIIHYRSWKCLRSYDLRAYVWYRSRSERKPRIINGTQVLKIPRI